MTFQRTVNWENDLQAYLESKRNGSMKCGHFVAGAIKAATGSDPMPRFRGRQHWAADNLAEAVSELFEERPVAFARTGDVVMAQGSVGICVGGTAMFMGGPDGKAEGIVMVPRAEWDKAWTVG